MSYIHLQCKALSHSYRGVIALRSLNITHEGPGCVALIGANGAGKSTLLRGLVGVQSLSSGVMLLNQQEIYPECKQREHIGYLSEHTPLPEMMTVYEVLKGSSILQNIPFSDQPKRIDWCVNQCHLPNLLWRTCGTLSRGQRQRVGLACAIIHQPQLLILDEVHSGLDPIQTKELNKVLKSLAQDSLLILSTHRLNAAEQIADHYWILHEGQLIQSISKDDWQSNHHTNTPWSLELAYRELIANKPS